MGSGSGLEEALVGLVALFSWRRLQQGGPGVRGLGQGQGRGQGLGQGLEQGQGR